MEIPLQITFRNMPPSQGIEDNIREKASKLESFYDRIMSCRVIVEAPHRHHRKGKAYEVRIDVTVPGGELVINPSPKRLKAAKSAERWLLSRDFDAYVALLDSDPRVFRPE